MGLRVSVHLCCERLQLVRHVLQLLVFFSQLFLRVAHRPQVGVQVGLVVLIQQRLKLHGWLAHAVLAQLGGHLSVVSEAAGEAAGEWHLASGSANFRTELIEIEI